MKRFHKLIGIVLSLTMITLISGCGGSSSSTPTTSTSGATGIVSLNITDAPLWKLDNTEVTEVNIAVIDIEYRHDDGSWTEADDFVPQTFNLIELQNGNSLHLGDMVLPVGHYTEIRFILDIPEKDAEVKSNPDCNITFVEKDDEGVVIDEWTKPLFVPSGGQSGYKAKCDFEITAEAQIAITADWDASRSVVSAGNSGKYLLKPVIRCVVTELSGWINGTVVDIEKFDNANDSLVVYAYEDSTYDEGEKVEIDGDRFPNAVTSSRVNMSDGNFTLAFLGAGVYDLVTVNTNTTDDVIEVSVVDEEEYDINGIVIKVSKGNETLVDVNTSDYPPTP